MDEQRNHKRARVKMRVAYRSDDQVYKRGRVRNISRSGMFVDTESPQTSDEYVIASLDVEDFGKVVWVQGRVVRNTNEGMAVVFTRTDEKGLDALMSFQGIPF
ncbi:MAG: PilZ domain-containing protein [Desulfomonilia bacterium]